MALTNKAVEVLSNVFQVEMILQINLLSFEDFVETLGAGIILRVSLFGLTRRETYNS